MTRGGVRRGRSRSRSALCGGLFLLAATGCGHLGVAPGGWPAGADRSAPAPDASEAQRRLEADLAAHDASRSDPAAAAPDREDFPDLLERLRAGFALQAVEHGSIQREVDWYVAHPDYLGRTFGRARRYLHHIIGELEQRSMPSELALLPVVESAFDPFAQSPRRASGLWQFIPSTGRRYGLDQNWWLDGRRDVREATRAALDHLQELHAEFDGDWLLALAAYNTGEGNVRRAVERNRRDGRPTDFFHLDLRPETRAYVPKLLAIAQLTAEPARFGVELPAIPNAPYFEPVEVGGQIDLGIVAELAEIPLSELRALNPAFERWATSPDGPHELLVPADVKQRCDERLARLPESERMRFVRHRVRRGETLGAIARRYGIALEALRSVNRLRGSLIRAGDAMRVPVPSRGGLADRPPGDWPAQRG